VLNKTFLGPKVFSIKKDGQYISPPIAEKIDVNDQTALRHGRDRYVGFKLGNYVQPAPLIFSRDGASIYIADMYRGCPAFLIAGGPSFANVDKTLLSQPGFLTVAINNSVKSYRPNLWFSVDDPTHFIKSIWLDPKITKFVPFDHTEKFIFDNEKWEEMTTKVGDCPNVFYYRRNESFNAEQFLFENTVNWGNHKDLGGGRSVMLATLRILFYLGVREVFLLGVDFEMSKEQKYHFEQNRSDNSIKNNNETFALLNERFTLLRPIFEKNDFYVYNCNPNSRLKVFPFADYNDAIKYCMENMPKDLAKERTEGLYDRKANDKKDVKEQDKEKTKRELDIARKELTDAKKELEDLDTEGKSEEEANKIVSALQEKIKNKREIFREKEKNKNIAWYGKLKKEK
jgi:hypothetical protein